MKSVCKRIIAQMPEYVKAYKQYNADSYGRYVVMNAMIRAVLNQYPQFDPEEIFQELKKQIGVK